METENIPHKEPIEPTPGRFGDTEQILRLMNENPCHIQGRIEDFYQVGKHLNQVEIADIQNPSSDEERLNTILGVIIEGPEGQELLRCIFKPAGGENRRIKEELRLNRDHHFYPHERAAFIVSEHFNLDLVPPTVIRKINDEPGALQLFINPEQYISGNFFPVRRLSEIRGEDFQKVAVLDWLLLNPDRRLSNLLISRDNPQDLIAIDHGIGLNSLIYHHRESRGPHLALTAQTSRENQRQKIEPKQIAVPPAILAQIEDGLDRQQELKEKLLSIEEINDEEVAQLINRAKLMLRSKIFLSRYNQAVWRDKITPEINNLW